MDSIKLDNRNVLGTVSASDIDALQAKAAEAIEKLETGSGAGNDFLGWMHLPSSLDEELVNSIENTASVLRNDCEYVVAIGIGGSYLGAKAVIEALSDSFAALKPANGPRVLFAGQNIGEDYMSELINLLNGKKFGIVVISKSGTTTEPAIAFRILKEMLEKQEGKEFASKHIVAVTDAAKGALRTLANEEGYTSYVIEDNIGGRFSVLTPVGLLSLLPDSTSANLSKVLKIWKWQLSMLTTISPLNMPRLVTLFITLARKSKSLLTTTRNSTSSLNGGNNSTAKAKVKRIRVFSQHLLTTQQTFTQWVNGFKKAKELSSKLLSLLLSNNTKFASLLTRQTLMV